VCDDYMIDVVTPPTPALQAALLAALDDDTSASKALRALWIACAFTCCRCGRLVKLSQASREHIVPRALGGAHAASNLGLAHQSCNHDAGYRPVEGSPLTAPHGEGITSVSARKRHGIHALRQLHGDRCWLCGQLIDAVEQMTRSRVVIVGRKGYSFANLRLAHKACQQRRNHARNVWNNHLSRSRARSARQRLVHRRRAVVLQRQHHVSPRRNPWTTIRAIVRSLFCRLRPSRRTHDPRPSPRPPRPSWR